VVLWRSENLANYLLKGKQVYVEGRISNRSYEQDGVKKFFTEIVADEVILLGGRGEGGGGGAEDFGQPASMPRSAQRSPQPSRQPQREESSFDPGITDDDVPF
jgi:single-strand DNA-binding protein